MADGLPTFDEQANLARVTAGWQDGNLFKNPNLVPAQEVVDGTPPGVDQKLQAGVIPQPAIMEPWVARKL